MSINSNNYTHITTAVTTDICNRKSAILESVIVNKASSAGGLITVSQTASAKVIAVIDATVVGDHIYNISNLNGIKIVTSVAAGDITVVWQG